MEKIKLSLEPYKGTRDFYPEDMFIQKYIFKTMRKVAQRYGYQEYNASILEETNIYRAKSGEEIVNEQTYSFTDRGGRDVTIRPEMTPTVARMVAQKRKDLSFPLRWYSIPNLLRYERPQRGRLREHWQLNVDIFGVDGIAAEKEMIMISSDLMRSFGITDEKFIIKINSRKLVNYFLRDYLKLDDEKIYKISKLIDRKLKMKEREFKAQSEEILGKNAAEILIREFLNIKNLNEFPKGINERREVKEIRELIDELAAQGIKNMVFDPSLMRGFDYYTGIVFEVFDLNPDNRRALFGGGRYDDLVGIFNVEKVPGVGFGMGDVTIRDVLETYNLLPKYKSETDLYICKFSPEYENFANSLAGYLRGVGVNVALDLTERKIGAQIKAADRQKIPYVVCIGEDEVKTGIFKVKELETGKEKIMKKEDIAEFIN